METSEQAYLRMYINYMSELKATPWWMFLKRHNLEKMACAALSMHGFKFTD